MAEFAVNKGVGKSVEVKGLRSQYFIYAVLGTVFSILVFFLLSFFFTQIIAVVAGSLSLVTNISLCFHLNKKFGEKGLSHLFARNMTPDRIYFNKRAYKILVVRNEN